MKNLAPKLDEEGLFQAMGTLRRVEGKTLIVETNQGEVRAQRAVSCLVEPMVNDYVLVAAMPSQGRPSEIRRGVTQPHVGYVLSVLERESPDAVIACDGNLDLKAREGRIRMASRDGIDLVSPKEVQIVADQVGIHASTAKLFAKEIITIGASVVAELATIKLKGTTFDKVFERVSERVQRSFRRVEELDQLKAKQMDYLAEQTLSLRSANAVVTATDLVKVDGEQIHFG